jgi:hypothetical protein
MTEKCATFMPIASLTAEERSSIAWALVRAKVLRGEEWKDALSWAVRNCAELPADPKFRKWLAEGLEGKLDSKPGRGRPKTRHHWDLVRACIERGISDAYSQWLAGFRRDRHLTWLRAEAQRLRQERPDAAAWRRGYDLGEEEDKRSFEMAVAELGARPCPPANRRGGETARELALKATTTQCKGAWESATGRPLTPAVVARLITRANKSE